VATICAWCLERGVLRTQLPDGTWTTRPAHRVTDALEEADRNARVSDPTCLDSHGMCPECLARMEAELEALDTQPAPPARRSA
jgi:hypothetical protein